MELIFFLLLVIFGFFIYWPSILLYGATLFFLGTSYNKGFKSIYGVLFSVCFWGLVVLSAITLLNEQNIYNIRSQHISSDALVPTKYHPQVVKIIFPDPKDNTNQSWPSISEPVCESLCAEFLLDTYVKYVAVQVLDGQEKYYKLGMAEECSQTAEAENFNLNANMVSLALPTGTRSVEKQRILDNVAIGFGVCALPVKGISQSDITFKVDDILPEAKSAGLYGHTIAAYNGADNNKIIARASTLEGRYQSFPPFPAMVCHSYGELGSCASRRVLELDYTRAYIKSISYTEFFHNFFDMNMDGNVGNKFSPADDLVNSFLQDKLAKGGHHITDVAHVLSGFAQRDRLFPNQTQALFERLFDSAILPESVDAILEVVSRSVAVKSDGGAAIAKLALPYIIDLLEKRPEERISSAGIQYLNGYILFIHNKYPDLFKNAAFRIEKGYFSLIGLLNRKNGGDYLVSKLGDGFWELYANNMMRLNSDVQTHRDELYHNFILLAEIDKPRAVFLKTVMISLIRNDDWRIFSCPVSVVELADAAVDVLATLRAERLAQCPEGVSLDNLPAVCTNLYNKQISVLVGGGLRPIDACSRYNYGKP